MLIQKTTPAERLKNTQVIDQLMFSFFDLNILGIKRVLSDNGEFLGVDKIRFLSRLNSMFNELKEKNVLVAGIHSGICVDKLPGCEVMEIRYALSDDLLDENGLYFCEPKSPQREGEVKLTYAFKMKEGKVVEIQSSRRYISMENIRCSEDNIISN